MYRSFLILAGALVWTAWPAVPTQAQSGLATSPVSKVAAPTGDAAPYIQAIEQASDPSALVAAYAAGYAADRTNLRLHEVYVSRMVQFGVPEMAYHQAQLVAGLEPRNGLAQGVLAYVDAKRGRMPEALAEIVQAANLTPDNAFVQRTAGELLAWYDRNFLNVQVADSLKDSLNQTRRGMGSRSPFAQSYEEARKALSEVTPAAPAGVMPAGPTTQTASTASPAQALLAAPQPQPVVPVAAASGATTQPVPAEYPPVTVVYAGSYPEAVYEPIYYSPQDYYPPGWWNWSSPWGWSDFGAFGSVVFIGHHHHHGDGDFDRDDRGWWHRGGAFSGVESPRAQVARAMNAARTPQQLMAAARAPAVVGASTLGTAGRTGMGEARIFRAGGVEHQGLSANLAAIKGPPAVTAAAMGKSSGSPSVTVVGKRGAEGAFVRGRASDGLANSSVHVFSPAPAASASTPRATVSTASPVQGNSAPAATVRTFSAGGPSGRTFAPSGGSVRTFSSGGFSGGGRTFAAPSGGFHSFAAPSGGGRSFAAPSGGGGFHGGGGGRR